MKSMRETYLFLMREDRVSDGKKTAINRKHPIDNKIAQVYNNVYRGVHLC